MENKDFHAFPDELHKKFLFRNVDPGNMEWAGKSKSVRNLLAPVVGTGIG